MPTGKTRMCHHFARPLRIHMGRSRQLRLSHSTERRRWLDQKGEKQLLFCHWTQQYQSLFVRSKTGTTIICNKPVQVYPTNYDSLYVVIDFGGFDQASGKRMGFSGGTRHLQYYQLSRSPDGRFFVHKPESPHTDKLYLGRPHFFNIDYKLHQGTKLDYLFFARSKML